MDQIAAIEYNSTAPYAPMPVTCRMTHLQGSFQKSHSALEFHACPHMTSELAFNLGLSHKAALMLQTFAAQTQIQTYISLKTLERAMRARIRAERKRCVSHLSPLVAMLLKAPGTPEV